MTGPAPRPAADRSGGRTSGSGFHEGELAMQRRAGVRHDAARLRGMLAAAELNGGIGRFLADRDFVVVAARDARGRLWVSALFERRGVLDARDTTLRIAAAPGSGDPLEALPTGQPIGVLAIEFAARRRVRVNGTLVRAGAHRLEIEADQAFGNCPRYIQQRRLVHTPDRSSGSEPGTSWPALTEDHRRLIGRADTFFLGTVHPTRGADASHRGGPAGFVRVDGPDLWWPDYPGNNLFNSLGNLVVDDEAALLFVDFTTGQTLHLTGVAEVEWSAAGVDGDDGGTGRRVRFTPRRIVTGPGIGVGSAIAEPSPHNPPLG